MIAPDKVITQARSWLGVRFLHQGRSRHGVDCVGFVACVLAELGFSAILDDLPYNYARNPQGSFSGSVGHYARTIKLQPGALMMIQFPFANYPAHCALYTGASMIHCHEMNGGVVEHGYQEPWVARTKSFWALPMVTYV